MQKPSLDHKYIKRMEAAKVAMKQAFVEVQNELLPLVPPAKAKLVQNLAKSYPEADPDSPCFDDIWENLKSIFDSIRDDEDNKNFLGSVEAFKSVIFKLIELGMPVELDKNINFWSNQVGRRKAEKFALKRNGSTDSTATVWLRKTLIEWPEKNLTIFHSIITAANPIYKDISMVFWTAICDIYLDSAKPGSEAHIFFPDRLIIGNYFWDRELPKAREKNLKLIIHVFNLGTNQWEDPVEFDLKEGDKIPIGRRYVHPMDKPETISDSVELRGVDSEGRKRYAWKKLEFKDDKSQESGILADSPKILTVGKMRKIAAQWRQHTRDKINAKKEAAVDKLSESDENGTYLSA